MLLISYLPADSCICERKTCAISVSFGCSRSAAVLPSESCAKRSMPLANSNVMAFSLLPSTSVERSAARTCSAVRPFTSRALTWEPASSNIRKAWSLGFEFWRPMVWPLMLRANLSNGVSPRLLRLVRSALARRSNSTISGLLRQAAACTTRRCQHVRKT